MPEINIRDLSRSTRVIQRYRETNGENIYDVALYESVAAGSLQRIADSLEIMQNPYEDLAKALKQKEEEARREGRRVIDLSGELLYRKYQVRQLERIITELGGHLPNWRKYR